MLPVSAIPANSLFYIFDREAFHPVLFWFAAKISLFSLPSKSVIEKR
jgi:CMP-N-acetylneuraminic acid synthetase